MTEPTAETFHEPIHDPYEVGCDWRLCVGPCPDDDLGFIAAVSSVLRLYVIAVVVGLVVLAAKHWIF